MKVARFFHGPRSTFHCSACDVLAKWTIMFLGVNCLCQLSRSIKWAIHPNEHNAVVVSVNM